MTSNFRQFEQPPKIIELLPKNLQPFEVNCTIWATLMRMT